MGRVVENMKRFRKERGISQTQLAQMIGKSRKTVQNYESGTTDIPQTTLALIADALQVSVVDFYGPTPEELEQIKRNRAANIAKEQMERMLNIHRDEETPRESDLADARAENRVRSALDVLNIEGKEKVASYAEDLTRISDYLKREYI